jgi:hypothetical protein
MGALGETETILHLPLCHNRATVMPQNNRIQPEPTGLG